MFRPFLLLLVIGYTYSPSRAEYDPLRIDSGKIEFKEFTFRDESRSRELPVRVYFPASNSPAPVVLFSHGLGGSRTNNEYLGSHWAKRGYLCVFLQHPGSDESLWKEGPVGQRMQSMMKAANAENFLKRAQDVPAVLDQLEKWNAKDGHMLKGRMDLTRIGMSGHSFGAVTTQAVSGQTFPLGKSFTDKRIKAAVAMSPSGPKHGQDPKKMFSDVKIPWLLMTGTKDNSQVPDDSDVATRLAVYPALPNGSKYEVVFENGTHMLFGDRELKVGKDKSNPNHHKAVLALTTAFWDAHVRGDAEAKTWLEGSGPKSILESGDTWKKK